MALNNYLQDIAGVSNETVGEFRLKVFYEELKIHSYEEIINYHDSWDWEKFTETGEF